MMKITNVSIILFLSLISTAAICTEQQVVEQLSLLEAIRLALDNNQDVARMREKINEVNGLKREVLADALPQVSLMMDGIRFRDPGILNSPNFQDLINDPNSPIPREFLLPVPVNLYNVSINVDQPIFVWGKNYKTLEGARIEIERTLLDAKARENDIAFSVSVAYYDFVLSFERLKALEKSKESQEKNLRIVSDKYEIGSATKLDLLRAKASLSNLLPQTIRAENDIKITRANLNYLMGREIDAFFIPMDTLEPPETIPQLNFQTLAAKASNNRPDLASIKESNRFLEKSIEVQKTDLRPRLDFFGNYGWSAIDYENLGNSDFESWRVGVSLSFTLFDGLRTSGRILQFQSQILQNDLRRQYLEKEIHLEIEKSLKELQRAYKSLEAANIAKEQAQEALKVAEDNFEFNAATQLEVLDSEEGVRQAELTVAQAKRDSLVSLATLKYLIGINALEDFDVE